MTGRVLRHEDEHLHAGPGPVSRQGAAGVARGGDGQPLQAEVPGHADGHGHAAALEAAGRQSRFILDPQPRQPEMPRPAADRASSGVMPSPSVTGSASSGNGSSSR